MCLDNCSNKPQWSDITEEQEQQQPQESNWNEDIENAHDYRATVPNLRR